LNKRNGLFWNVDTPRKPFIGKGLERLIIFFLCRNGDFFKILPTA